MDQEKLKKLQQSVRIGKSATFLSVNIIPLWTSHSLVLMLTHGSSCRVCYFRTSTKLLRSPTGQCRGKGTPRRSQKKKPHKTSGTDDKKLQTSLKKLNVQPIQAIEEVNMFKEDGNVIHFAAPKGIHPPIHPSIHPMNPIHLRPHPPLSPRLFYHFSPKPTQTNILPPSLSHPHSPRLRPLQHLRHLRQRRGQRTDRARARHPQPARPGQPRQLTEAS